MSVGFVHGPTRSTNPALAAAAIVIAGVGLAATPARGDAIQERAARPEARAAKNPLAGNRDAIRDGGAKFRSRCAGCHGPDAHGYIGPDITGLWAAGDSDERVFGIVRRGVPGTEMTPADPLRVPDREIWQILAFLRTLTAPPAGASFGDAQSGERIFRATCSGCHMVNGRGGQLGPDLSRIGSGRSRTAMLKKIRGTSDAVRPGFEAVTLVTRDGQRIRGVRKNEDEFSIQIMDTRERLQGYMKDTLTEIVTEPRSVMPAYAAEQLGDRDLDDLLQYLSTLRRADVDRY
jgi:putative heme-binding domain-containing protein